MKMILLLASLLIWDKPTAPLLLVDTELKKPAKQVDTFTTEQYLQRGFPVYASDVDALIDAADKVVRQIETAPECYRIDTIPTAHSVFYLVRDCDQGRHITVSLVTTVEESGTSYGFTIVKREMDRRKAQQKLLDFAMYLNQ